MRRKRRNKQRKLIILTSISLLFILTVGYAAFQTNLNISAKGNIKEKSRVIKSFSKTSNEDFHSDVYRQKVVTINFINTNQVPNNALESWDVSEKQDGGVMAYVLPSTNAGYYDVYIGANKGVIASENSSYIFWNFPKLWKVTFDNNYDTSNAVNMSYMFAGGNEMASLDLSSFDTTNVTSMQSMFSAWNDSTNGYGTRALTQITFGEKFVTNNVTDMGNMFAGQPLKALDLRKFDTSKVTNMFHMFNRLEEITELNLCSFDTRNVTNMKELFSNTPKLTKVKVGSKWTTVNADTSNIFYNSASSSVTTGQC